MAPPQPVNEEELPSGVVLARWLQESGRRRIIKAERSECAVAALEPTKKAGRSFDAVRRPLLLALLALALLQYLYVDVGAQLLALRHLIFFIFAA